MVILVKIIGIIITVMGVAILLNPKIARGMMAFWRQGKRIYLGGLIRILLGILFLASASGARLPQVIFVLGVLALLGGLLIFILGPKKTGAVFEWWDKKPEYLLRLLSLVVITFGALIVYSA